MSEAAGEALRGALVCDMPLIGNARERMKRIYFLLMFHYLQRNAQLIKQI